MPVGNYFKGGLTPTNFLAADYDRAAHKGTGQSKVGGNYAASLLPGDIAHKRGFSDCIYLDPIEHKKIEEVGSANFFGITRDGKFVTPKSPSILPSVTKYSLLYLAEHNLGMETEETDVYIDQLDHLSRSRCLWDGCRNFHQSAASKWATSSTSSTVKQKLVL